MKSSMKRVGQRARQRGIVAVMAVIFLITAVVFVLTQTLNITGTTSIDNTQQRNSAAALFLAESGLQRGQAVLGSSSSISNTVCTGIGGATSYPLSAGSSFTLSAESSPADCNSELGPFCASCTIESTGTANGSTRTIRRTISLTTQNGKGCNTSGGATCANPVMNLVNNFAFKSIALFNLAYDRQGNSVVGTCTATGCAPMWFIRAKQTNADMGNAVTIAAGAGYPIQANLTSTNYSFVGALFPGSSAAGPTIVGSYWSQQTSGNCCTTSKGGLTGTTNNGVDNNTDTLTLPVDASSTEQLAKSWCYGGDTMVYGFGGTGTSTSDQLSAVTFNTTPTSTSYPGNIPLTRVARYPNATSTDVPSNHDIYSEIWYVRNPDYLSTTSDASSGGTATGTIGARVTGTVATTFSGTGSLASTLLTITGTPTGALAVGDAINGTGVAPGTYVVSLGTGTGGAGTYNISPAQTVASTAITVSKLTVTTFTSGQLTALAGDKLTGGTIVTSGSGTTITKLGTGSGVPTGGNGTYYISPSQTVAASTAIVDASNILYVSNITNGFISVGDTVTSTGVSSTINSFGTGTGVTGNAGTYLVATPQTTTGVAPTITAAGRTIHSTSTSLSTAGTIVKVRSGTGNFDAGATVTGSISGNILTVTAVSSGVLSLGDRIFGINGQITSLSTITGASGSTICPTCTGAGGTGTYRVSASQTVSSTTIYARRAVVACTNVSDCFQGTGTISGTTLTITGTPTGNLSVGDTLAGAGLTSGTFITSLGTGTGGAGTYNIYPSQNIGASTAISAAPNASLFKISGGSQSPLTPLSSASICGGICAFFDAPLLSTSTTTFAITKSANTDYWSSGFMCLKGVDVTPPIQVFSSARTPAGWTEVLH